MVSAGPPFRWRCLQLQVVIRSVDEAEREQSDECFADGADCKWTPALAAELAEIGAKAYAGKSQQECPAREVGEAGELRFGKEADGGEQRDEQESKDAF